MFKKILFICSLALIFLTCAGINAQSLLKNGRIPKDLTIKLKRTICYGTCPDYELTINNKGTVSFHGGHFTQVKDTVAGQITQVQLKKIIAEFQSIRFFSLRNTYRSQVDGCRTVSTDAPSQILSIHLNGRGKEVSYYLGCNDVPGHVLENLSQLAKLIDTTTDVRQWIGK